MSTKFFTFVEDFKLRHINTAQKSFAKASSKPNSSVAALIDARNRKKFLESLVDSSGTLIVVPGVLMEHWQVSVCYSLLTEIREFLKCHLLTRTLALGTNEATRGPEVLFAKGSHRLRI